MKATAAQTLVEATRTETDLRAVVWDRAPSHQAATGMPLIALLLYAPELNPAERVVEHLRAGIEGVVYPTIEDRVAAVETILATLLADPTRVHHLTSWHWITAALNDLPEDHAPR